VIAARKTGLFVGRLRPGHYRLLAGTIIIGITKRMRVYVDGNLTRMAYPRESKHETGYVNISQNVSSEARCGLRQQIPPDPECHVVLGDSPVPWKIDKVSFSAVSGADTQE
jgi:hypothetical protein